MWASSLAHSRQEEDQTLVPLGGDIGEADDHEDADERRGGGEPHAPPCAAEIRWGHDSWNADQYRHVAERSKLVDIVERGVEILGQHGGCYGQADRARQGQDEKSETVERRRLGVRHRRIEDPELLPFLALLHALGELGFLVALQQRAIELPSAVVVAGKLSELLLSPRNILDSCLVARDALPNAALLGLEDLELRLHLTEGLFQPERIWGDRCRRGWRGRPYRRRVRRAGFSCGEVALERCDFRSQRNDVWVSFAELRPKPGEVLFLLCQAHRLGRRQGAPGSSRHAGRGEREGQKRFGFRQLTRERLPPLCRSRLTIGVPAELIVHPVQGLEVGFHLLW